MELIIFLVVLCIMGALATRFGFNSRTPPPSKEQRLAELGTEWGTPAVRTRLILTPYAEPRREGIGRRCSHAAWQSF